MSRLVVNPPTDRTGPPHHYELPVRLPQSFDLRLEVWGNPESLAQTKIAGLRLLDPRADRGSQTPAPAMSWHQVRICRESDQIRVELDQVPLSTAQSPQLSPSLNFETPANSPAHFRNLLLTW